MAWVAPATGSLLIKCTDSISVFQCLSSCPFARCIHVHCSMMARHNFYLNNKLWNKDIKCDKLISLFLIRDRGGLTRNCVLFPFFPLSPSSSPLTEGYTVSGKFNTTRKQLHVKRLTACWTFINLRNPFLLVFMWDQEAMYALCVCAVCFVIVSLYILSHILT